MNDFKVNHCTTLIPEPQSKLFFVKIPVTDYNELSIIKTNLLTAIKLIADYNQLIDPSDRGDITYSIGTLVKLLGDFGLEEECEGLSDLIS